MKYILENKQTEPDFKFMVKTNKPEAGYFLYNSVDSAMEKAMVLSLAEYPIVVIYEPVEDRYGDWVMQKTFLCIDGRIINNNEVKNELHVKFYLESGEWLNYDSGIE